MQERTLCTLRPKLFRPSTLKFRIDSHSGIGRSEAAHNAATAASGAAASSVFLDAAAAHCTSTAAATASAASSHSTAAAASALPSASTAAFGLLDDVVQTQLHLFCHCVCVPMKDFVRWSSLKERAS
jgi:hypothetical protein